MTPPATTERRPELVTRGVPERRAAWIENATSADHKTVAKLFIVTSLTFLAVAALQFLLVRLQLIVPDSTILVPEVFNRINSAAQVTAVVFFAVPLFLGIIGYVVPLQIGARGVALPRLNQLSYWLYAAGAFVFYVSFLYTVPETALAPLPPLSDELFSPSGGVDAWVGGVALATLGFVCFAVNLVATIGAALSLVAIDRIPFGRPDEPLLQARRERAGADAFALIDLPRATTLLAQGAGRLIRAATDHGVVAVLDPRLASAGYRWEVVRALPPMRRTKDPAEARRVLEAIRDGQA